MKLNDNPKYRFARSLRTQGYSYFEIANHSSIQKPRSTIVTWCTGIKLSAAAQKRLDLYVRRKLKEAQTNSANSSKARKLQRKAAAAERASGFELLLSDAQVKRIILGTLYLAEGSKGDRGGPTFGNSDPEIIALYLSLLRSSFDLDESKFRCTLQARDGQDIQSLEKFWGDITNIPKEQFYTARIDSRGKGQLLRKPDYKGVCRIDYLSTELLYEILAIGRIITKGR